MQSKTSISIFIVLILALLLFPLISRQYLWPFVPFDMYSQADGRTWPWIYLEGISAVQDSRRLEAVSAWRKQMPLDMVIAFQEIKTKYPSRVTPLLSGFRDRHNLMSLDKIKKIKVYLLELEQYGPGAEDVRILSKTPFGESD